MKLKCDKTPLTGQQATLYNELSFKKKSYEVLFTLRLEHKFNVMDFSHCNTTILMVIVMILPLGQN